MNFIKQLYSYGNSAYCTDRKVLEITP